MSTGVFSVDLLRRSIAAQVIGPTDAGYDEARAVWNGSIDRRPLAVVRPADTAEVAEAVAAIRASGADLTVRGGGHHCAGHAVADGAVLLDLSKLDSVLVDAVRLRARCGGGATWAELDGMANRQGLAVTGGFVSDTGIGGLTLGGGVGWLTPLFGMSCDNLVAAEVVTAEGHVVVASMQENPDLFWALRGGGGNFGIATSFEFTLHEFGPMVQVALLWWPPSEAVGPLIEGHAVLMALPARHCGAINAISAPPAPFVPERWQGEPGFVVGIAGDGSANDLADAVAPLRALTPTPAWELVAEMPYAALQQLFDDIAPWGTSAYEKSLYLDRIDAAVAEVMVEQYPRKSSPLSVMPSMPLCGRFCDVPEGNTAFGGSRAPGMLVNIAASCPDPAVFATEREWVREFWGELRPFARGDSSYVNFLSDPGQEQVAVSYGTKYHRLRSVKATWDPDNVFRHNANITPASPE